jgi:opacity protein-like surface antigen
MQISKTLAIALLASMLAACAASAKHDANADAKAPPKQRAATDDYLRYVEAGSVPSFGSKNATDWTAPDPNHVVVWVSPAEAYLLTLVGACFGLETSQSILLGNGAVMVGPERCPVSKVERLDARAMKADGVH